MKAGGVHPWDELPGALLAVSMLVGLLMPPTSMAATLGRLFLTAEQRVMLDEIRNDPDRGKAPAEAPVTTKSVTKKAPSVPSVTVNGIVLRSSGGDSTWINGHEISADEPTPEGVRVRTFAKRDAVRIILPEGTETAAIKPGQRIDVLSGKIVDAYQQRVRKEAPRAFNGPAPGDDGKATRPPTEAPPAPEPDANQPDTTSGAVSSAN